MTPKLKLTSTQNSDPSPFPNDKIQMFVGKVSGRKVFAFSVPDELKTKIALDLDDKKSTVKSVTHGDDYHDLSSITLHHDYNGIENNRFILEKPVSKEERNRIVCAMYADGMTETEISIKTGIPQSTVSYIIRTCRGKV